MREALYLRDCTTTTWSFKHQQYLDKNPDGYCGIGGTGVACPIGVASVDG